MYHFKRYQQNALAKLSVFLPFMHALREQILILFSTPLYIVIIGLEILLSNYRHQQQYGWIDTFANIYFLLLNSAIDLLFRSVYLLVLNYFYQHRFYTFTHLFSYWLVLVISEDFLYYWLHRVDHQIRIFWAVHVTHHSSEHMNFTVGFRSSVFQPLYRFIYFIPLAAIGFRPLDIVFIYSVTQIWGILVHTELVKKMGWLEYLLVTPSHHRVHHASNPKYLDKNMGMLLIIWDRLFGTFQPELTDQAYQPKKYGLTKPIEKKNPVNLVFHEWRNMLKDVLRKDISIKEKWNYLFGPPGWSHDGSSRTSQQLREMESAPYPQPINSAE
jgi:sterol desaturase/sphingolipid hydroxylase (fatty acid hydroxylase superfamily)